ncbi:IPTL-CTERM sorting domain-containing protein [Brevundimonas sp.]|uniref:IPTL-CTERM sorting domain-containing protein n=1 Tax=Brevundimonas sp. TaxID=1871086 RepID=UPI002FDB2555
MKNKMIGVIAGAVLAASAGAASAGTLTNASVTLSNSATSQPTGVTIRYTTATALTAGDNLLISNFNGLTMVDGVCGATVTITVNGLPHTPGSICAIYSASAIQINLDPLQSVPAGALVEISIAQTRVTTSATPGLYATVMFRTALSTGVAIDTPAAQPTYLVTAAPVVSVPTMSEWAMILLTAVLGGFAALTLHKRRRTA